jgi:hypothetical protein
MSAYWGRTSGCCSAPNLGKQFETKHDTLRTNRSAIKFWLFVTNTSNIVESRPSSLISGAQISILHLVICTVATSSGRAV